MVGRFRYEILLPGGIDEQTVDAQLKDGVLTVRIPKTKAERATQISVK
jgi:HSP20 family protein